MLCFLSFYDDLGTPPTWRPHSWKKMGEGDDDATFHEGEGESLSNRPSSSHVRQGTGAMTDECDEAGSTLPPHGVDNNADDSSSNSLQSNGGLVGQAGSWRSQFKNLRQSAGQKGVVFRSFFSGTVPPATLYFRPLEPVVQDGLNKGWQKLHWEIYKEIIDRKCLLSMRHSPHKGHDDSLREGGRIHFVLTGLFLLGRICLSRSCSV